MNENPCSNHEASCCFNMSLAGPGSAVNNVSDCRYVSNCRSGDRELDPGQVPYFRGD